LADLEAEIVHRRLLTHSEVLALGLTLRLFLRAGDVDGDERFDLRMGWTGVLCRPSVLIGCCSAT